MREQRALGHGPNARVHVVIGQFHPIVHAAMGLRLHDFQHLGFALQAVGPEFGNGAWCIAEHVAVGRGNEFNAVLLAGLGQQVQRVQVVVHVAVWRVDHGGAAVEDVVA